MIVGNKSDLQNDRKVKQEQARQLVDQKNTKFIETSALADSNCNKCVEDCIKLVMMKKRRTENNNNDDQGSQKKVVCDMLFNLCNLI